MTRGTELGPPEPATPSLSNLPPELMEQICTFLCSHCSLVVPQNQGFPDRHRLEPEEHRKGFRRGLLSLTRCCRALHRAAQPFICHRLANRSLHLDDSIRFMSGRPELASQVKSFVGEEEDFDMIHDKDVHFFQDLARNLNMAEVLDDFDSSGDWDTSSLCSQFIVVLFPKLEVLGVDAGSYDVPAYNLLAARFRSLGQSAALPNLHALKFSSSEEFGYCLDHSEIGVLLGAAVNLRCLAFQRTFGASSEFANPQSGDLNMWVPALQSIRKLVFSSCALDREDGFACLHGIIRQSPNLKSFSFHSVSVYVGEHFEHFRPIQFIQALSPCYSSLEELDLNLEDSMQAPKEEYWSRDSEYLEWWLDPTALNVFTRLQVLKLDEMIFCRHCVGVDHGGASDAVASCLTGILPATVRELYLRLAGEGRLWVDIEHLGSVANQDFPLLQKLTVETVYDDTDDCKVGADGRCHLVFDDAVSLRREAVVEAFSGTSVRVCFSVRESFDEDMSALEDFM